MINLTEWATEKVPKENLAKFVGQKVQGDKVVDLDATGLIKAIPQPQPAGTIG